MNWPEPVPERRELSLRRILVGAFVLPWRHRGDVIKQAGIPLLALIAFQLSVGSLDIEQSRAGLMFTGFVYLLLTCWLAICVHRMVLMDAPGSALGADAVAMRRLFTFVTLAFGLGLIFIALKFAGLMVAAVLGGFDPVSPGDARSTLTRPAPWVELVTSSLPFLVIGRLALAMPMVATDRPYYLHLVWRASVGNGLKLALIVGALPWAMMRLMDFFYRNGATAIEIGLLQVVGALAAVVEIVAVSLAFRDLSSDSPSSPAPPPTDPLA